MPMAAVPVPMPTLPDCALGPALPPMQAAATAAVNDAFAKDAIIAWFRGEFAAANAIIDALCGHLAQLGGGYEGVFEAVHRRRMNWIPVLQMQKYYSIADVAVELGRVVAAKETVEAEGGGGGGDEKCLDEEDGKEGKEVDAVADEETQAEEEEEEDSPNSDITDSGK